jgi:hypothetical protein
VAHHDVARLCGTHAAETILASGHRDRIQKAGHMDASDPIQPNSSSTLQDGGRPHMDCFAPLAMTNEEITPD